MKYTKFNLSHHDFSEFSLWQSPSWKHILHNSGQAKEVFYFGNPETTFFLIEIRSLGAGFFGAFSLGVKNFQIASDIRECNEAAKRFLQEKGVIFWQIEPIESIDFFAKMHSEPIFKKFLTPFTRVISLEENLENILANMPQKGRYAIKNAEKKGVEIEIITDFSEDILNEWMYLLEETTTRDKFSHNSREYYCNFLQTLGDDAVIVAARYQEKYIAMTISVFSGDTALYYYGASTSEPEARKLASSYLTLWKSLEFAQKKEKKVYDLFGVADPNNPNDPLLGVSQFKQKLGGELVELPKKTLQSLSWKYHFFQFLQKVKKYFKK